METPDDNSWFWQQSADYATEILGAVAEHLQEETPVTRALELFKVRIMSTLESIRVLQRNAKHNFIADGMTLLRAMYEAHLQALYILAAPDQANDRAQLYLDYPWIEQRRMQNLLKRNDSDMARGILNSPKRAPAEAAQEDNFQRLRPRYLKKDGNSLRDTWYTSNLYVLATEIGLGPEHELLQRQLSGAVHSTPTNLLTGGVLKDPESQLVLGWRITLRVLGRIAQHHGVPLEEEHSYLVRDSMNCIFDAPP